MGGRAPVAGAVAGAEAHRVCAERELDAAGDDEQQLLRVPVRVLLGSGRPSRLERRGDDLECFEGLRRQERLAPERAPADIGPVFAAQHARSGLPVSREQVGNLDAERTRDAL